VPPGETQFACVTPVVHTVPRQQTPAGGAHGFGEQATPPPCHARPAFWQSLCVWFERQKPLAAQQAPVGGAHEVVLHATPLPRYAPPCAAHADGVAVEHAPVFTMQQAPVGHAPLTHATLLPWYCPPAFEQSLPEAVRQAVPKQHAPVGCGQFTEPQEVPLP
jgi:hypothetical protein